jgi:hypothetical protein
MLAMRSKARNRGIRIGEIFADQRLETWEDTAGKIQILLEIDEFAGI